MNDFNEPGFLAPTGLYLGGTKYLVIQGEPGAVIRGKKVMSLYFTLFVVSITTRSLPFLVLHKMFRVFRRPSQNYSWSFIL